MISFRQTLALKAVVVMICCLPLGLLAQSDTTAINTMSENDSAQTIYPLIFYKIKKSGSTASASVVPGTSIRHTPVMSFPAGLAGQLPGLKINQTNGQPLNEGISMLLRGRSPLVLIDGIPRSITEIGIEEIESVTVLKDAVALAMLGVRGAGGAISVVTKKGAPMKSEINFSGQWGTQQPTQNLIGNPLDAYQYALLYNEALKNDGLSVANNGFSDAAIQAYKDGSDPYLYPNVNWRDEVTRKSAPVARYNINARGGNEFFKYFVNLEHFNQDGFFKTDNSNNYSTNAGAKGYFVRSNVDVKITDRLDGGIYIMGRIMDLNAPGSDGANNIFQAILNTPASAYPIRNPNGSFGGSSRFQNNILGQSQYSGYFIGHTRTVLTDFYLRRDLDDVLPGLWAKARVSFFSDMRENYTRSKTFAVFQIMNNDANTPVYGQYGTNSEQGNSNAVSFQNRSNFQEFSIGYSRNKGLHDLDLLLLANRDNLIAGSNLKLTVQGISAHASYMYDKRFIAEFAGAYNGANRYPSDGGFKYGLFPSIGLGWNLHNESFLKNKNWLNELKVHGSYGMSGLDNGSYFTYIQSYNNAPTTYFGTSATSTTTIAESFLANPNITYEKAKMLNIGFDSRFLNNRLSFDVDYYFNKYSDLSIIRGTNSGTLGIAYPNENIGKQHNSGIEAVLGWKETRGKFGYSVAINAAIQQTNLVYNGEPAQIYEWMQRTGHPVGLTYGYVAEGLYQTQAELDSRATTEGYIPQLGDIKFKDLNNDGAINQYDMTIIGSEKPSVLLGANLGLQWSRFDLSTLLVAELNRQVYPSGNSYREFLEGVGQAFEVHLDRWTPANPNASYPRLTTNGGPFNGEFNNAATNSFWLRNGNFLRVRSLELGYSIPASILNRIKLKSTRVFVNGYNLFSLSSKTFNGADPENYRGLYPIQKVVSFGIHVKL
ncbi:SusC/RagA family TonB-linked outer membrane protein [Niabella yanshanensis]|uniref:SusC/RagA family TonB-linked outer membrane protein n=1 Tax=Niabella yanshanensis TaxID=577386 RepID=A0ABZ0W5L7_9BACT|nr:SusC/RagA family TonB-linked outer membrane protein [Niabella yanshanensis]WQD38527.1 SusC/RagA family TonB-linked outer membrane protein [Niabella yanshanensis]